MREWRREVRQRLAPLHLHPTREAEILDELVAHVEERYRELRAGGADHATASRDALADLAGHGALARALAPIEPESDPEPLTLGRATGRFLAGVWADCRYGTRILRRTPAFTIVAIVMLALGIGANTAIFQLLNAVTLRALPIAHPEQLVELRITSTSRTGNFNSRRPQLTYAQWQQLQLHGDEYGGMFAWAAERLNLTTSGESRYANSLWVSGEFFNVLGVRPAIGRVLTSADDQHGCSAPSVVLSDAFWQRTYGGDPGVIGKTLTLNGHPFEIAGVTPPGFFGVEIGWRFDVAAPICAQPIVRGNDGSLTRREFWWLAAMARLKPGVSAQQATARLVAESPAIFEQTLPPNYPPRDAKNYLAFQFNAFPTPTGVSQLRRDYATPLWLLMAMTGGVLLIACANLANLLLARGSARGREIAVRLALGASRVRLVRQLLAESLLLAAGGAVMGIGLAPPLSRLLISFIDPAGTRVFVDLQTDWRVLAFTGGLGMLTCVLVGLVPAIRATSTTPAAVMKSQGRGMTAGRDRVGFGRVLVVVQVALSFILVVGAVLFVRTFHNLASLDAGFRQDGILLTMLDLAPAGASPERLVALHHDVLERVRAIPGVMSVAEAEIVQLMGNISNDRVKIGAEPEPRGPITNLNLVSPGYLKMMGTPLVAGRDFTFADDVHAPKVAIISEAFRGAFFKGADPIGQTFRFEVGPGEKETTYQIVGVMRDVKYADLREAFKPLVYLDIDQTDDPDDSMTIFTRADLDTGSLMGSITRAAAAVNPRLTMDFRQLNKEIGESLVIERLMATLSGCFGALAAILATVGLYGVMSYSVSRRRNEIGIRMALGADAGSVIRMIVREAAWMVVVGLLAGAVAAYFAARTAATLLFGLTARDPIAFAISAAGMALIAFAASYWPARRASLVDPMRALREE